MIQKARLYLLFSFLFFQAGAFTVERNSLVGIWKLVLPTDAADALNKKGGSSLTIKLQDDGSFQQFDEDDDHCLEGCWDYEDAQLQLAIDRSSLVSRTDTLLSGKVSKNDKATVVNGEVSSGKFMYPQTHAAFFDQVMAAGNVVGKFKLKQVMAFNSVLPTSAELEKDQEEKTPNFKASDFFGRNYVMTVVPIECKVKPKKTWDKEQREWVNPLDDQAVDIRSMKIQFHANSTFQAFAINKILRGRFEVTKDDKLWFHVSRFGMGRSMPGSVYSEGIGLSHEDERTYIGTITPIAAPPNKVSLKVEGKVTFGADLGSDARPEPVGAFLLTEVLEDGEEKQEDDSSADAEEDDIFNSVFE